MSERGFKVSFEGIDGVGKSTQKAPLKEYLEGEGYEVFVKPCRNDMHTPGVDDDVLNLIKGSSRELRKAPATDVLLQAARMLYVNDRLSIPQRLATGAIVLCDRDIDSAVAYSMPDLQRKYEASNPQKLTNWVMGLYAVENTVPDLTLLLDADPQIALNRAMSDEVPNERAIFDENGVAYIREVRKAYHELQGMFPDRIKLIDVSDMTAGEVAGEITDTVGAFLHKQRSTDGSV